jgi:hypothetical protein
MSRKPSKSKRKRQALERQRKPDPERARITRAERADLAQATFDHYFPRQRR